MKRVFLMVLDGCGAGEAHDAALFGDEGANTLLSVYKSNCLHIPTLLKMGLGNIEKLSFLGTEKNPTASFGSLSEKSAGNDTITGHWEISGVVSDKAFPTYPNGFSDDIISRVTKISGRGVLCNRPYSGTEVIKDYGDEHLKTGKLIVYTSADSVMQIAAHSDIVPLSELYEICQRAYDEFLPDRLFCRIIARPFEGKSGEFYRTKNRRDYALKPPFPTMLDAISEKKSVIAVGKINDIFSRRGVSETVSAHSNAEVMDSAISLADKNFEGLCFMNFADFDMLYGHRNDPEGYAEALNEFDSSLPLFLEKLHDDDMLVITADHGCDPGDISTDHTRENVPLLIYSKALKSHSLGLRDGFANVAATICDALDVKYDAKETGFYDELKK